jgi:hypothetical protein
VSLTVVSQSEAPAPSFRTHVAILDPHDCTVEALVANHWIDEVEQITINGAPSVCPKASSLCPVA